MKKAKRIKPTAAWKHLDGPPGHGKSPVWEHPNGARLHAGGYLRLPDRSSVDWWDARYSKEMKLATAMQPQRRARALMVWAEMVMSLQPYQQSILAGLASDKPFRLPVGRFKYLVE